MIKLLNKSVKALLIFTLLLFSLVAGMVVYAYYKVDNDLAKIVNYTPNISTEILDRNGKRIAYIFKKKHRLYATYDEIPIYVVEGLVAMEDTKFFEHKGINPDAILRAIIKDIKARRFVEGGSTITQQLIKNTLLSSEKKLSRKVKEFVLAIKLENVLSKEEILERYLNAIPYGNNYMGIKTAAEGYFRKNLRDLSLKESAMLVGLPNAPSYYNPLRHYKRLEKRANLILHRLYTLGWISKEEYLKAKKEKPKVYKTTLTQNVAPYVVDEVVRRLQNKFKDIKTGGYKIYTTVDLSMQNLAKKSLDYGYTRLLEMTNEEKNSSDLNGAMVVVQNNTGDILSLVGGVDYKKSSFNRVTMTKRQPGSSFKPFVYQRALDLGYSPATKIPDLARSFKYEKNGKMITWTPQNYEKDFRGFITLREALIESRNLATVNMVYDIGIDKIINKLKLLDVDNIPRNLSIALGNLALSPMKMAQIYTVFSNYGHIIEPRLISKMVSKYGSVIYETKPKEIANFTKPEQAYLMTSILKDVIKRGTGTNAQVAGIELAGKTGTTNDYIDAWFCGYSPEYTTIIWYGRDAYKPIKKGATGGKVAAPVFAHFYNGLLELKPKMKKFFVVPKGVKIGFINGRKEYYTKTSPLPHYNREVTKESNKSLPLPEQKIAPKKQSDSPIDVIELYDEDTNEQEVEQLF